MPIENKTDSLTSYHNSQIEQGSYSIYSNPKIKKINSNNELPIDSMESAKIKKEALERLNNSLVSDQIHAIIMRIAKYAFIAIAWPPYALLFEFPQWVFSIVSPPIKILFVATKEFIQKQVDKVMASFILPIVSFVQKTTAQIIAPFVRFGESARDTFNRISSKVGETIKEVTKGFKEIITFKGISNIVTRTGKRVRDVVKDVTKIIKQPFEKLANLEIKKVLSKMMDMPIQMLDTVKQLPNLFLGWAVNLPIIQQTLNKFSTAQGLALAGADKTIQLFKSILISPLAYVLNSIKLGMGKVHSLVKSYIKKGFGFLRDKTQEMGEWVESKAKALITLVWEKLIPSLFSWLPKFIQEAFIRLWNWLVGLSLVQSIFKGISSGYQNIIALPGKAKRSIVEKTAEAIDHMRNTKNSIKEHLNQIAKKIDRLAHRVVYWTLTTFIMGAIIFEWGIELLGTISSKIFRNT
jgi:hypothetical protein